MELEIFCKTKKILIIEGRSFGDAVIKNSFITALGKKYSDWQIDVLCKKEYADLFFGNSYVCNLYFFKLPRPVWSENSFVDLMKKIFHLRQENYDLCIDVVGDMRERSILRLISPNVLSAERIDGHPGNNEIWRGWKCLVKTINIPKHILNVYDQHAYILKYLGASFDRPETRRIQKKGIIGIHPFASRDCKFWSWEKWKALIQTLLKNTPVNIWLFCMPDCEAVFYNAFGDILRNKRIQIQSLGLLDFINTLGEIDLLIGLDSLAIHAAYSKGIPNIMLCGSNNYDLWRTPLTEVVSCGDECPFWPCLNRPVCRGDQKYICMKNISVNMVYDKVVRLYEEDLLGSLV